MKIKKKFEEQQGQIKEQEEKIKKLEDRIKYFELKEQGATINPGAYGIPSIISYAYDGEIKEVGVFGIYKIIDETEQNIIIQSNQNTPNFDTGEWKQTQDFYIIDKEAADIYDIQALNKELKRFNEKQKVLKEIIEQNEEKGE